LWPLRPLYSDWSLIPVLPHRALTSNITDRSLGSRALGALRARIADTALRTRITDRALSSYALRALDPGIADRPLAASVSNRPLGSYPLGALTARLALRPLTSGVSDRALGSRVTNVALAPGVPNRPLVALRTTRQPLYPLRSLWPDIGRALGSRFAHIALRADIALNPRFADTTLCSRITNRALRSYALWALDPGIADIALWPDIALGSSITDASLRPDGPLRSRVAYWPLGSRIAYIAL